MGAEGLRATRPQSTNFTLAGPSSPRGAQAAGAPGRLCRHPEARFRRFVPSAAGLPSQHRGPRGAPAAPGTRIGRAPRIGGRRAEPGRAATPRAAGPASPGSAGAGAGAGAARGGPAQGAVGRSPGAAAAAAAEDGARGARTWRPARGRGQGRLLRRAAAPRAGAAASMAPSPRTSSRQDATALPSMSSTFWAFMILASLLIAYCSEYRAARVLGRPSGPDPGPRSPFPGRGSGGAPRGPPVVRAELRARGAPSPGSPPVLRWAGRARGRHFGGRRHR